MNLRIAPGLRGPALFLLLVLLFLWPALANRQPFMFPDTSTYVRGVDMGMQKAFHIKSDWDKGALKPPKAQSEESVATTSRISPPKQVKAVDQDRVVLAGRSIYYGAFIYISYVIWQFWPLILFQATLLVAVVLTSLAYISGRDHRFNRATVGGAAFLALVTPAAFFADIALPDIFCSFAIVAAGFLLFVTTPDRRREIWLWTALLTLSLLCHSANVLMVGALFVLALVAAIFRAIRPRRSGILMLLLALILSQLGEFAFSLAVSHATGHHPVRPPFLTARLVDDGPGTDFVRRTCPGNGFAICRYAARLPAPSDTFLWNSSGGVFQAASPADQRLLGSQDGRFALAVLRDRPALVVGSTLRSVAEQLVRDDMGQFNYQAFRSGEFIANFPRRLVDPMRNTLAYRREMPTGLSQVTALPLALLSFGLIGWWLVRFGRANRPIAGFVLTIVIAVVVNSVICGAFSTPHGRYQMRVVWLLPMIALGLLARADTIAALRRKRPGGDVAATG